MLRRVAVSVLLLTSLLATADAAATDAVEVFDAARSGDLDRFGQLIAADPSLVNAATERGSTTLLFACVGGNTDIVRLLLNAGADANAMNDSHYTPLQVAAGRDYVQVMELLIEAGADIEAPNLEGETALHCASNNGARRAVEFLLDNGADPHARNSRGRTPLILVARECGDLETARVLLRAGANIDAVDDYGDTSLDLAAWRGYTEFVAMLLEEGAEIPASEDRRIDLLTNAARRGLDGLAQAIILAGLDLDAVAVSHPELMNDAAAGGSVEIMRVMAESGFRADHADENGWTPLHCSAEFNRMDAIAFLIEAGAPLDARTLAGETAYHIAVTEGSDAAEALLKERGGDTGPVVFPELRGSYMGQKPPGDVPEPFAPGIVMAHYGVHSSVAFAPDGLSAFWRIAIPPRESAYGSGRTLTSRVENGRWSHPARPDNVDGDVPFFSPDGDRLYFISSEPVVEGAGDKENIWFVERTTDGWTDPTPFDPVVNSVPIHWQFSVDRDGTFYIGSGDGRIFVARRSGGSYEPPVDFRELHENESVEGGSPFISPDGDYLIFSKEKDLHVTFRRTDGSWSEAANMGEEINSEGFDNCPMVTPDGLYLIYNTSTTGTRGPHWVAIKDRLAALRKDALG